MQAYNLLLNSKKILNNFRDRHVDSFYKSYSTLKSERNQSSFSQHEYGGMSEIDFNKLVTCVGSLGPEFDSEIFEFDVQNNFITPEKAINKLNERLDLISRDLDDLKELKEKYKTNGEVYYPLGIAIDNHQKVVDIFQIVLSIEEVQNVLKPNHVENLEKENLDLKFSNYWTKQKVKYIINLLLFLVFLISVVSILIYRDEIWFLGIVAGLIPIINSFISKNRIMESFEFLYSRSFKKKKFQLFKLRNKRTGRAVVCNTKIKYGIKKNTN